MSKQFKPLIPQENLLSDVLAHGFNPWMKSVKEHFSELEHIRTTDNKNLYVYPVIELPRWILKEAIEAGYSSHLFIEYSDGCAPMTKDVCNSNVFKAYNKGKRILISVVYIASDEALGFIVKRLIIHEGRKNK